MAAAYGAIANDGVYIEPTFYTKVVDGNGNTVFEPKQESRTVMSASAAYVVKEVLTQPVKSGTSTTLAMSGMSVAAKQVQQIMIMIDGCVDLHHIILLQYGMDTTRAKQYQDGL